MTRERVALVTGATGAIGRAIAAGMAAEGFRLILLVRDADRGERAAREVRRTSGHDRVSVEVVDLARRSEIEAFARRFPGPLDVLIQNAATAPRRRQATPEGIEVQLATNVLAYLWLAEALAPALESAGKARIVNVASYWAGDLDLSDLEFSRRRYDNDTAYRQSKQANRMLTVVQAERYAPRRITVNVCHPGDVSSTLSHDLGFGGSESPEEGARTPLWLATSRELDGVSGRYFERGRESACRFGRERAACAELYRVCAAR